MAAEVLCRAMNDDVRPVTERVLEVGAHERIINDCNGSGALSDLCNGSNVGDFHKGVGRCFDPDHSSVLAKRFLHVFRVSRVHVSEL